MLKIFSKKEFNDNKYIGAPPGDIEIEADRLCNASFELSPHQMFVTKLHVSTYTIQWIVVVSWVWEVGKHVPAIGIAEETRDYLKQIRGHTPEYNRGVTERTRELQVTIVRLKKITIYRW
jgi:hypothetical protein